MNLLANLLGTMGGRSSRFRDRDGKKRPGARGHAAAKVMVYYNTKFVSRDSAPVGRDTNTRTIKSIVNSMF